MREAGAPQEYARLIRESRKLQLSHEAEALRQVERLLARVVERIAEGIRAVPRGVAGARYRRELLASALSALDNFRSEYQGVLDGGILTAARTAEERERDLLKMLYETRAEVRPDQALRLSHAWGQAQIQFGEVPRRVLERAYLRTFRDGKRLYQRLYDLEIAAHEAVSEEIILGVAQGLPAKSIAANIAPHLTASGVRNVRFRAMTLARTEINIAYREGHVASVTGPDGKKKPWVLALGFRLSPSHPRICVCDLYASQDNGLGPGNYEPEDFPACPHPRCLCFSTTILVDYPQWQFVSRMPKPELVTPGERKFYGLSADAPRIVTDTGSLPA